MNHRRRPLPGHGPFGLDPVALGDQSLHLTLLIVVVAKAFVDGPQALLQGAQLIAQVLHGAAPFLVPFQRFHAIELGLSTGGVHGQFQRRDHRVAGKGDFIEDCLDREATSLNGGPGGRGHIATGGQTGNQTQRNAGVNRPGRQLNVLLGGILVFLEQIIGKFGLLQHLVRDQ